MDLNLVVKTANELNDVLGLVPPINTSFDIDAIKKLIVKASSLVNENDFFSDDVTKVLIDLNGLSEEISTVFELKLNFDESSSIEEPQLKTSDSSDELKRQKKRKPHIIRLEELIAEGTHTANQIVTILLSEFLTLKKETIANYIRSAKSEKYTQFSRVAIEDLHEIIRFK